MTIAFISHSDCALHEMGADHPECPARLTAIEDQIIASGLDVALSRYDAPLATREQLCRVHDEAYVEQVFHNAPQRGRIWLDPDTAMNPYTLTAALRAAGAVGLGVDLVLSDLCQSAFCNVRPPGHHAERKRAMGFCIFNNIAVGAAHALHAHHLQKIAIVDFDVHHGNGTEDIFRHNPSVLYCSTFQHPFYPHTGVGVAAENIVSVPLPGGAGGSQFRAAVTSQWLPRLIAHKPELIFISAGFDAHIEDDMAGLRLHETDFAWVTTKIREIAEQTADGKTVSVLEGGYALHALGRSVAKHLDALLG